MTTLSMSTTAGSTSASVVSSTRSSGRGSRRAPRRPGCPAARCSARMLQRLRQLPVAASAARVVEGDHEVALGRGAHPPLDDLPRRVQVGQADVDVVVAERRAEQRRGGERRGDPGHADDVDVVVGDPPGPGWPSRTRRRRRCRSARPRARRGPRDGGAGPLPPRRRGRWPAPGCRGGAGRGPGRRTGRGRRPPRPRAQFRRRAGGAAGRGRRGRGRRRQPAARRVPGDRDGGHRRLPLLDHELVARVQPREGRGLGDARRADRGRGRLAGLRHVDRGEHGRPGRSPAASRARGGRAGCPPRRPWRRRWRAAHRARRASPASASAASTQRRAPPRR